MNKLSLLYTYQKALLAEVIKNEFGIDVKF
jgi:hypothetical protein